MHWKLKAHLLACLSRIPGGRSVYHLLQRVGGTNRLQLDRDLNRAFELVELAEEAGGHIAGSDVLEVGTGWRPLVPFVFSLAGAERIVTVDVNPWLTLNYALETWQALESRLGVIANRCHVDIEEVRRRYSKVPKQCRTLQELLGAAGIEYRYPADARATGLPDGSVDFVVSSNVLEHIPRDIQVDIHKETRRILRPAGLAVHRFNPQDHYSTVDSGITMVNFLQYSSQDWHWLGGSGLSYHNRLRSRDYVEMFQEAGLEIAVRRERVDERSLQAVQSGALKVHPEFAGYSARELAVDYMWLAGRKGAPVDKSRSCSQPACCAPTA